MLLTAIKFQSGRLSRWVVQSVLPAKPALHLGRCSFTWPFHPPAAASQSAACPSHFPRFHIYNISDWLELNSTRRSIPLGLQQFRRNKSTDWRGFRPLGGVTIGPHGHSQRRHSANQLETPNKSRTQRETQRLHSLRRVSGGAFTKAFDWRGTRPAPWASLRRLLSIDKPTSRPGGDSENSLPGNSNISTAAVHKYFGHLLVAIFFFFFPGENEQPTSGLRSIHRRTTHKLNTHATLTPPTQTTNHKKMNQKTKATFLLGTRDQRLQRTTTAGGLSAAVDLSTGPQRAVTSAPSKTAAAECGGVGRSSSAAATAARGAAGRAV